MKLSLFLLLIICTLSASTFAASSPIHGFFIQPALGYGATDFEKFNSQVEYDSWIKSMADIGAEMIFYQWSAHYEQSQDWYASAFGGASSADFAFYNPSPQTLNSIPTRGWSTDATWAGTPSQGGKEPIEYTLDAAAKHGVKVWLGLYLNENTNSFNWWDAINNTTFSPSDSATIQHHIDRSKAVALDLISQYANHPAFGGLYYSIEVANLAFIPPANHPYLAHIIQSLASTIHNSNPDIKLAMCPFFNSELGSPQEFGEMWDYVLANADLDILMIQDGVGVDPSTLTSTNDEVSPYLEAIATAAKSNNTPLWGNAELFTNLGSRESPNFIPSDTSKIKSQIQTLAPHVDKIVSFGFEYLDPNPNYTSISPAQRLTLYEDYQDFYQNWKFTQGTSTIDLTREGSRTFLFQSKEAFHIYNSCGDLIDVDISTNSLDEFRIDFHSQAPGLYFLKSPAGSFSFVVFE